MVAQAGPAALSTLLDDALRQLPPNREPAPASDGFLYSGNRHESVPRALFLDTRLTPLERNTWQIIRLMLNADGVTAFPTYDQLRPYLASTPCAQQASYETVARALTMLRLTRWLSLVRRRRDPKTGRIKGNLYVLHDGPLTPFEAMQLDPEYLGLVSHALEHASKAVQRVGYRTLQDISEDPLLSGRVLPTRLQVLVQRMAQGGVSPRESYPQAQPSHESEEGKNGLLRNGEPPSSDAEAGTNASKIGSLRNPKRDRTSTRIGKSVPTVPRAREHPHLRLPEGFLVLREEQQAGALVALQQVQAEQRQAVLDEWAARCRSNEVRKPAGYLFGIIQAAIRGEFNAWAGQDKHQAADPLPAPRTANPEVVHTHLAQLHALLHPK
ncbi:hypothetical protein A471_13881 [Ectopseudomonas mendocina DLHK]|nr:hypothetical protein A471_13881 [Pseudomonas mendocina DLHK]